jgi:hypothetical protein
VLLQAKSNKEAASRYRSRVTVERLGEMTLPVEVLVHFENGREVRETWDGQARTRSFSYEGKSKVAWAQVDPQNKLLLRRQPQQQQPGHPTPDGALLEVQPSSFCSGPKRAAVDGHAGVSLAYSSPDLHRISNQLMSTSSILHAWRQGFQAARASKRLITLVYCFN